MTERPLLTAEQFVEWKHELPDGGQWCELHAGEVVSLSPPDLAHGTTVLNLSKALAEYFERAETGYACFELGLLLARDPDTVRSPAVSCFSGGRRFAETDKLFTETAPSLVVEVASTSDRQRNMSTRVSQYLKWGVGAVWVIEPEHKQVHIHGLGTARRILASHHSLEGGPMLSGFSIRVQELFAEPKWWTG